MEEIYFVFDMVPSFEEIDYLNCYETNSKKNILFTSRINLEDSIMSMISKDIKVRQFYEVVELVYSSLRMEGSKCFPYIRGKEKILSKFIEMNNKIEFILMEEFIRDPQIIECKKSYKNQNQKHLKIKNFNNLSKLSIPKVNKFENYINIQIPKTYLKIILKDNINLNLHLFDSEYKIQTTTLEESENHFECDIDSLSIVPGLIELYIEFQNSIKYIGHITFDNLFVPANEFLNFDANSIITVEDKMFYPINKSSYVEKITNSKGRIINYTVKKIDDFNKNILFIVFDKTKDKMEIYLNNTTVIELNCSKAKTLNFKVENNIFHTLDDNHELKILKHLSYEYIENFFKEDKVSFKTKQSISISNKQFKNILFLETEKFLSDFPFLDDTLIICLNEEAYVSASYKNTNNFISYKDIKNLGLSRSEKFNNLDNKYVPLIISQLKIKYPFINENKIQKNLIDKTNKMYILKREIKEYIKRMEIEKIYYKTYNSSTEYFIKDFYINAVPLTKPITDKLIKGKKYDGVVLSQHNVSSYLYTFAQNLAIKNPNKKIAFLLHPRESVDDFYNKIDNIDIVFGNTSECIKNAKYIFGGFSTSLYEAKKQQTVYLIKVPGIEFLDQEDFNKILKYDDDYIM